MHFFSAVLLGAVVGFSLGLVGGGGSILTVPLLVYAMGEPVSEAIGTALAIVGVNALVGFLGHWRERRADIRVGISFGLAGTIGAVVGTWLGHRLPGGQLLFLFALLMLLAALATARRRASPRGPSAAGVLQENWGRTEWLKLVVAGVGVGLLTGFFGVGGGFVIVPALVVSLRLPMHRAIGTSLLIITINSAVGLVTHLQYGRIDLPITALFIGGGVVGTLIGTRFAGQVSEQRLRQLFAAGLVAVSCYLLVKNHPSLSALILVAHSLWEGSV
jgi:uncharacterized membrane protein YfcA